MQRWKTTWRAVVSQTRNSGRRGTNYSWVRFRENSLDATFPGSVFFWFGSQQAHHRTSCLLFDVQVTPTSSGARINREGGGCAKNLAATALSLQSSAMFTKSQSFAAVSLTQLFGRTGIVLRACLLRFSVLFLVVKDKSYNDVNSECFCSNTTKWVRIQIHVRVCEFPPSNWRQVQWFFALAKRVLVLGILVTQSVRYGTAPVERLFLFPNSDKLFSVPHNNVMLTSLDCSLYRSLRIYVRHERLGFPVTDYNRCVTALSSWNTSVAWHYHSPRTCNTWSFELLTAPFPGKFCRRRNTELYKRDFNKSVGLLSVIRGTNANHLLMHRFAFFPNCTTYFADTSQ